MIYQYSKKVSAKRVLLPHSIRHCMVRLAATGVRHWNESVHSKLCWLWRGLHSFYSIHCGLWVQGLQSPWAEQKNWIIRMWEIQKKEKDAVSICFHLFIYCTLLIQYVMCVYWTSSRKQDVKSMLMLLRVCCRNNCYCHNSLMLW